MLNDGDFRKGLDKLMNHPDSCSKEELYVGFLEMTERYLNEMITTMNFENAIIEELGEKRGEAMIEDIATSNPAVQDLDLTNITEPDLREVINNLLTYIECEFGYTISGDDSDDDE